jgi:glycosyltransferase involved in cell wall biosynthesis
MRVLFLARWYPSPAGTYLGIFIREHAKAARAAGAEVAVLHAPGDIGSGGRLWRLTEETDQALTEGIRTFRLGTPIVRLPFLSRIGRSISYGLYVLGVVMAYRSIRSRAMRPDIVHAHVWNAAVPATVLGKLFRVPIVVTEHSTEFQLPGMAGWNVRLARWSMTRAARVLPVCENLRRAIVARGIEARFEIVPNAVDTGIFYPAAKRRTAGARGTAKRLLFVGNLEPTEHKGFPTLIQALSQLVGRRVDWHFDVVGDGPSRAALERAVAESGLSRRVSFLGSKPKPEIAELMRGSDLFVLPSRFENLPCVIIEAMACGLPVLSTRVGGIPEMVTEQDGLLVEYGDATVLAEALDRMLDGLATYSRDAIAAGARERFSLEAVGRQLAAVYDSALETR